MGRTHVHHTMTIQAPVARVFDLLTDHESMADWPGVGSCRLVQEGEPRNGLGAVRELKAKGLTLQEEVVRWDPPNGFAYRIIRGLPVDHLGEVSLEETGEGTHLTWDIRMSSRWPLVTGVVGGLLRDGLPRALAFVKGRAEAGD